MLRHLVVAGWLLTSSGVLAHPGVSAELAELNRKLAERPLDPDLLLSRASLFRQQGKPNSALADLGVVARKHPKRRELFLERGLVLAALGQRAAAESDLTRFLDSGAPTQEALRARAALREAAKRWAQARADYDAALKLRNDAELYLGRGRADEALGELDRAAAGYDEGLRALSGAVVLRVALVRVETARGRYDHARALVEEVLAVAPNKAEWLLHRADVHAAAGRPEQAERDRTAALQEIDARLSRRPNDLARLLRARACLALGRKAEAIAELEGVVKRSPGLTEASTLLARVKNDPAQPRKRSP